MTFCGIITKRHQEISFLSFVCNKGKALQIEFVSDSNRKQRQIYVVKYKDNLDLDIIRILKLLSGYEWLHVNGSLLKEKHMRTRWIFNLKLKTSSCP